MLAAMIESRIDFINFNQWAQSGRRTLLVQQKTETKNWPVRIRACPKTGVLATLSAAFDESFVEVGQKTRISTKVADKVELGTGSNYGAASKHRAMGFFSRRQVFQYPANRLQKMEGFSP